jgi:hypothetical protein
MPKLRFLTLALGLTLVACGDDDADVVDAAPPADSGPDAAVPVTCTCLNLGSDGADDSGAAYAFLLPSLEAWEEVGTTAIGGDPVVRFLDGRFFVVNRSGAAENVIVIEPVGWQVTATLPLATDSAPADVAFAGGKAYVVTGNEPTVKVFDLVDPTVAREPIELPRLDDEPDENPDASSIVVVGERAYVLLGHREDGISSQGQLAIIDTSLDQVVATLGLPPGDPSGRLHVAGSEIYLALGPGEAPGSGCLARITTGDSASAACVKTAAELGGQPGAVSSASDGSIFVAVAAGPGQSQVVRLDADGVLDALAYTPDRQQATDLAVCGPWLVSNNLAGGEGSARVFDVETRTELTPGTGIDIGEPAVPAGGIACFED